MSSPIYIPDKRINTFCQSCKVDCSIEASGASKYMDPVPRPRCGCPFGLCEGSITWIQ